MTTRDALMNEIERIPEPLVQEVLDFARFLHSRYANGALETALASETALAKDWLRPEEDEAWQDL